MLYLPSVLSETPQDNTLSTDDLDYPGLFIASAAEIVGCTIAFALVDRIGRKYLSGVCFVLCAGFVVILAVVQGSIEFYTFISCSARATTFIASSTLWVVSLKAIFCIYSPDKASVLIQAN